MLKAFQRFLDHEAVNIKPWFEMTPASDTQLKHVYQAQYNTVVLMRQYCTMDVVLQFLSKDFDTLPPAVNRVFIDSPDDP